MGAFVQPFHPAYILYICFDCKNISKDTLKSVFIPVLLMSYCPLTALSYVRKRCFVYKRYACFKILWIKRRGLKKVFFAAKLILGVYFKKI